MIDLKDTFECGQCFRWNLDDSGKYIGVVGHKIYVINANDDFSYDEKTNIGISDGNICVIKNLADIPPELYTYLDMGTDYESIQKELIKKDKTGVMKKAVEAGKGIHILRQDLWETIVSFIISQNNNIPRIKGCIEKLSEICGEYIGEYEGKKYYSIPSPEKLAGLTREDLASAKLGYRDKFLIESAKMYVAGERELSRFPGVGPKVESCIKLFGMHDMKSFPIDVWVKKIMNEVYGFDENDIKGMAKFAAETFGDYAGLAQQYLFNYVRNAK